MSGCGVYSGLIKTDRGDGRKLVMELGGNLLHISDLRQFTKNISFMRTCKFRLQYRLSSSILNKC